MLDFQRVQGGAPELEVGLFTLRSSNYTYNHHKTQLTYSKPQKNTGKAFPGSSRLYYITTFRYIYSMSRFLTLLSFGGCYRLNKHLPQACTTRISCQETAAKVAPVMEMPQFFATKCVEFCGGLTSTSDFKMVGSSSSPSPASSSSSFSSSSSSSSIQHPASSINLSIKSKSNQIKSTNQPTNHHAKSFLRIRLGDVRRELYSFRSRPAKAVPIHLPHRRKNSKM